MKYHCITAQLLTQPSVRKQISDCESYGNSVWSQPMAQDRFDSAKDAANREKHKLPLAFGDRIFEDVNHLIIPSIRD